MSILELEHLKHTSSSSNNLSVHSDGTVVSNNKLGIGTVPNATFGSLLYAQGTPAANKPIISGYSQGNSNNAGLALFNDTGNRGIWTGPGSSMRFTRSYEGNSTVDMNIDTSGRITTPNQPSFMVYGAWSYAASTNIWKGFATVDHNIGSHWNNTTGRFTAPIAGRYMIYAAAHHSTVSTYHLWAFLKNGTAGGGNWVQSYDANGGNDTTSKTQVWNLAAGDYLEVASNGTYSNAYQGGYVTVGGHLVG